MTSPAALLASLARLWRRLRSDARGNVLMLMGFSVIPLTLATGMAIDYSRASRLQTKLNAAADAAALAAVTQPMMKQDNATAKTTAQNMFNAQAANIPGLVYNVANLTVTIVGTVGAANTRTATVSYTAQSNNAFSGVIGFSQIAIGGTSVAHSDAAPNIDFYMLMDTSPSMLLPATSADLATMTTKTGGCAFACHQTSTSSSDPGGTSKVGGVYQDYYAVARANSLTLRTDLVTKAVQDLTDTATTTAASNGAAYRMGLADFDYMYRQLWPTAPVAGFNVDSSLSRVKTHVTDATVVTYCNNNNRICGVGDNDTGTNFTAAFTGALASMPISPGNGTNVLGDTPQAILFIITDGMRDENNGGTRYIGPIPTSQCTTIKGRGIRIAILYTEYLPESASDDWSKSNVRDPYLSPTDNISPALINCASSGLFYQVTTNSDISGALSALFQKAVSTAHLTQ